MKNMSFSLTESALRRFKDVTRRLGWQSLKPGEKIQAVRKLLGLKKGQKIEPICIIEIKFQGDAKRTRDKNRH